MATKKHSTTPKQKPTKLGKQWDDGFEELADAQNLFQAIDSLAREMYSYTDHNGAPTLIALEAVAEKGLRCLTDAWSAFEAIKDGRLPQKAAAAQEVAHG